MQGSQDELKEILQEKLLDYEVRVPRAARDFIFANIGKTARTGLTKKLLYSAAFLLSLSSYFTYENELLSNDTTTSVTTNRMAGFSDREIVPAPALEPVRGGAISGRSNMTFDKNSIKAVGLDVSSRSELVRHGLPEQSSWHAEGEIGARDRQSFVAAPILENSDSIPQDRRDTSDESIAKEASPEVVIHRPGKRIRFNVSVMPLLAFSHVVPNAGDGAIVSDFRSTASLDPSRLGARVAFSVDYDLGNSRFLYGGASYFNYKSAFTYKSDESVNDLAAANAVDQRISGFGLSGGMRYPLKITADKRRFITGGLEAQFLTGQRYGLTSATQLMVNVGYASELPLSKGFIRLQPTISYSLTRFQYPGLSSHPYWVGLDVSYVWPR